MSTPIDPEVVRLKPRWRGLTEPHSCLATDDLAEIEPVLVAARAAVAEYASMQDRFWPKKLLALRAALEVYDGRISVWPVPDEEPPPDDGPPDKCSGGCTGGVLPDPENPGGFVECDVCGGEGDEDRHKANMEYQDHLADLADGVSY